MISFGKDARTRDSKNLLSPGPGAYNNVPKKDGHFYIGQKLTQRRDDFSPGPAQYTPKPEVVFKHLPNHPLDKAPRGDLAV